MRRGRVVEPEHVPSPFTVHFPGVMPSGPRSLVVLCSAVIARRITKDIRLPDALPVDARVAILEEMRYCCTLSDDTFPILITFANGSPCLPRSLKLRSCEFVSDRTLRYISELNTRDSHKNLREIDVRGCTKVTYDAIHELFSAQTSKTADFGGKGSKVPLAKPLVRVRTYPLPVLAAYQADRIIQCVPPLNATHVYANCDGSLVRFRPTRLSPPSLKR